ncbi:hypothetical protein SH661x_003298 [Planctomicrobium sp. SH661]|uniref:hypothetical protein n=1 Tax=Planctomicrobium sp. SH661 TaxID=3448124 RepID=UPI003F5B7707
MHIVFKYLAHVCLTFSLLASPGCPGRSDAPQRRAVSGTVTYDGTAVAYGTIRFIPEPTGPVATAVITEGKYLCNGKGGIPVGKVRVEIESMPDTRGMSDDQLLAGGVPKFTPIPAKYHQNSDLIETIQSGNGELTLDFHLTK